MNAQGRDKIRKRLATEIERKTLFSHSQAQLQKNFGMLI